MAEPDPVTVAIKNKSGRVAAKIAVNASAEQAIILSPAYNVGGVEVIVDAAALYRAETDTESIALGVEDKADGLPLGAYGSVSVELTGGERTVYVTAGAANINVWILEL